MNIHDRIIEMKHEAKRAGIPCARLYLSDARMFELENWLAKNSGMLAVIAHSTNTFAGMKVVRSSKPGMSIGR